MGLTESTYRAEFASGARAELTISPTAARIDWTPEFTAGLRGQRLAAVPRVLSSMAQRVLERLREAAISR